jgi:hypothetical protein
VEAKRRLGLSEKREPSAAMLEGADLETPGSAASIDCSPTELEPEPNAYKHTFFLFHNP